MEPRKLRAILSLCKEFGATSLQFTPDGGMSVTFPGVPVHVVDVPALTDGETPELPDGVIDPRKTLAAIYARDRKAA